MVQPIKDLSGLVVGRLTVLRIDDSNRLPGCVRWVCQCSCGNVVSVARTCLTKKERPTKSCGCLAQENARAQGKRMLGLKSTCDTKKRGHTLATNSRDKSPIPIGYRYHRLVVLKELPHEFGVNRKVLVRCDCGVEKSVLWFSLRDKYDGKPGTQSCGCQKRDSLYKGCGELTGKYFGSLRNAARQRGIDWNITIDYAWELFIQQNRLCALTGEPLSLDDRGPKLLAPISASLDRIDSNIGYLPGNVWWVHRAVNFMKNTLPVTQFIEWCSKVSSYHNTKGLSV